MTQPPASESATTVLVLNHRQVDLRPLLAALTRAGLEWKVSTSLAESERMVQHLRASLLLLVPLLPAAGEAELALAQAVQRADEPVPVILLVEDLKAVDHVRTKDLPLADFALSPVQDAELVRRIEQALSARERMLALSRRARELESQVSIDFKTELLSERYFRQVLAREHKRAQRHQSHLSLLLVDVDDFKTVNDTTDYAFGDVVLRHVAHSLARNTRDIDYAARFGGDEFALLLPHTTPANAVQTAIRVRKMIAEIEIRDDRHRVRVTSSIGIDTYDGRTALTPEELLRRANKALHEAKRRGKNQVWLFADKELDAEAS